MTTATTTQDKKTAKQDKLKDVLGPTDPKVDREVREILVTARIGMLMRCSFFGNLATRLKLVNADEWCHTAATDGRHFYYNTKFIKMLRPREVEFLFGHEVLHCVYDHLDRRSVGEYNRDPQLWNVACDYAVNGDLKKHKVGEMITTVDALYDPKYENWASEEIYDDIYENAEKIDIEDLIDKLLDDHLEDEEGGKGGSEGDEEGKGRPTISEEERKEIRDEIKEAVIKAAQISDAGDIPSGVKRLINELTEPKLDWNDLVEITIQSTIRDDYTFTRPSRKGWHVDAVLPGMNFGNEIDIAVGLDLSGSITEVMVRDFLSQVRSVSESFDSFRIHLFTFDTGVYNYKVFTNDNFYEMDEYELRGGGGTEFTAIFDYLKENDIEPEKLICFTDGYPWGSWGDPNYCDTLWVIHSNPAPNPPFGTWVEYK